MSTGPRAPSRSKTVRTARKSNARRDVGYAPPEIRGKLSPRLAESRAPSLEVKRVHDGDLPARSMSPNVSGRARRRPQAWTSVDSRVSHAEGDGEGQQKRCLPRTTGAKVNGTPPGRGAGGVRRTRPIPEPGRACLTHALHALLRRGLGVCPRPHTSGAAGPWRKASQLHHRILRTHWPSKLCRFCVFVVFLSSFA